VAGDGRAAIRPKGSAAEWRPTRITRFVYTGNPPVFPDALRTVDVFTARRYDFGPAIAIRIEHNGRTHWELIAFRNHGRRHPRDRTTVGLKQKDKYVPSIHASAIAREVTSNQEIRATVAVKVRRPNLSPADATFTGHIQSPRLPGEVVAFKEEDVSLSGDPSHAWEVSGTPLVMAMRFTEVTDIIEEPHRVLRLSDHQDGGDGARGAELYQLLNTSPAEELGIPLPLLKPPRLSLAVSCFGH
jgi:hypothetical protein